MLKVDVYNLSGKKVGDVSLDQTIFGVEPNDELMHHVYVAFGANKRKGLSHTKTISQRRGSTRKPWKQKGTGRARTGSIRNPIWRKGGVTFGPTKDQNFSKKVNKKVAQKALKMALSGKVAEKKMIILEDFNLKENKTKLFAKALNDLKIDKKVLIGRVIEEKDVVVVSRNIPKVSNELVGNMDMLNVLNNTFIFLSKGGLKQLEAKMKGEKIKVGKEIKTEKDTSRKDEKEIKDPVNKTKKTKK